MKVTCAYSSAEKIAIFTANAESLQKMHDLIKKECHVDTDEDRYVIVGCRDVPGFEAVEKGEKVDVEKVTLDKVVLEYSSDLLLPPQF